MTDSLQLTKADVDVMAHEYGSLRAEMLSVSGYRFQLATVVIAGVAVLANWADDETSGWKWVAVGLAIVVLVSGLGAWLVAGRHVTHMALHVSRLEERINEAMGRTRDHALLTWETLQLNARREYQSWGRITMGDPAHLRDENSVSRCTLCKRVERQSGLVAAAPERG